MSSTLELVRYLQSFQSSESEWDGTNLIVVNDGEMIEEFNCRNMKHSLTGPSPDHSYESSFSEDTPKEQKRVLFALHPEPCSPRLGIMPYIKGAHDKEAMKFASNSVWCVSLPYAHKLDRVDCLTSTAPDAILSMNPTAETMLNLIAMMGVSIFVGDCRPKKYFSEMFEEENSASSRLKITQKAEGILLQNGQRLANLLLHEDNIIAQALSDECLQTYFNPVIFCSTALGNEIATPEIATSFFISDNKIYRPRHTDPNKDRFDLGMYNLLMNVDGKNFAKVHGIDLLNASYFCPMTGDPLGSIAEAAKPYAEEILRLYGPEKLIQMKESAGLESLPWDLNIESAA